MDQTELARFGLLAHLVFVIALALCIFFPLHILSICFVSFLFHLICIFPISGLLRITVAAAASLTST